MPDSEGSDVINDLLQRIRNGSSFLPLKFSEQDTETVKTSLLKPADCPRCESISIAFGKAERFTAFNSQWPWFASGIVLLDIADAIHLLQLASFANEIDLAAPIESRIYEAAAVVREDMTPIDFRRLHLACNGDLECR